MNVGNLLDNAAAKYPGRTALISSSGRVTFSDLQRRCSKLAGAFLSLGLKPGDRVAVLSYNTNYLVETYFASVMAGLVGTPVNFRLTGPEAAYILNDSGSKALVLGPEFEQTLAGVLPDIQTVENIICPGKITEFEALDYEKFLAGGKAASVAAGINEGHPCQIMYTSGTTGRPKGAIITHGNVLWNLMNTIHGREDRQGQRSIIVGPLYHTAALNNHLTIQLSLGGTSILVKSFEPEKLLRIIQEEKATTISGSPAMYNLLMQHPKAQGYDRASITKCTAGADKLPMETKRRLLEFFPNIKGVYDVYGCTEASPCIVILNEKDSMRKDGSVGLPLPFLDARVVTPGGEPIEPGKVGEIICRGPNVMQGYHNQPEATAAAIRDGWLHTGDLATLDDEGFFYIVDRKNDMIVSGGENIYPREIEEVLYTHPAVADAAVIGVADPVWGQNVKAYVVLKQGHSLSKEEVIAFCKKSMAGYKKPKLVEFIDEIPRNASGKALKMRLAST